MGVTIELTRMEHAQEILEFEIKNRDFFESVIPPRPNSYYDIENLNKIIKAIIDEQEQGLCYMYIIRNEEADMVGRVNLYSIYRSIYQKAEIGYRIGKDFNGRGYATKAIGLACNKAFNEHKLHKIEAGTSVGNIGSQVALIKNGFQFVGRTRDVVKLHGKWVDGVLLERVNQE